MTLVDAVDQFRSYQVNRMMKQLEALCDKADANFIAFRQLAVENLPEAIRRLPEFISAARDASGNRAYEGVAGGPNQDWIVPLFNVFGECYTALESESRVAILKHLFNYFNSLRYDYSQNHVERIESAALVADIVVSNGLYWPGIDRPKFLLAGKDVEALKRMPRQEFDSFWIALAIIYNNACGTPPVRQWYYKEFPEAVEAAIGYLAAVFTVSAEGAAKKDGTEFDVELTTRLNKHLDPAVHERVLAKITERTWIILPN